MKSARVAGEQRRALLVVARGPHGVHVDGRRLDREEHVRRRAQLLDDRDVDVDRRQRGIGRAGVVEVLRADAEDHGVGGAVGRPPALAERNAEARELTASSESTASTRFIDGEPMNAATKRFRGSR